MAQQRAASQQRDGGETSQDRVAHSKLHFLCSNFHQSKFINGELLPVNFKYRSCTPCAPFTRHDCVFHLSKAPVGLTLRVPINSPDGPSSLSSMELPSA